MSDKSCPKIEVKIALTQNPSLLYVQGITIVPFELSRIKARHKCYGIQSRKTYEI